MDGVEVPACNERNEDLSTNKVIYQTENLADKLTDK